MESKEQKTIDMNKNHTCTPDHCCNCDGCGAMCMRGGEHRTRRNLIFLILVVMASFFVGMKVGEIKAYMIGEYGSPMRMYRIMDRGYNDDRSIEIPTVAPDPVTTTTTTISTPTVAIPKQ